MNGFRRTARWTSALAAVTWTGACAPADRAEREEPREVAQYTIQQFLETTSYASASFSPDNSKLLVSHDGSGVFNAYAITLATGEAVPLTSSTTDAILAISYFPDGERFLYTADQGGNELNHLYVRNPDGSVVDLTPGADLKAQFAGWGRNRETFFVATNERDARFFDLYRYRVTPGYPREMIYRNDQGYFPGPVSRDARYVALTAMRTTDDTDIYVFDRNTGETTHVTPHEGEVSSGVTDFAPDGSSLYMTTDEGSEFSYLLRYDLADGERTVLEQPEWDVVFAYLSEGGRYLVSAVNADARTDLRVYEAATMQRVELPTIPDADIASVSFSQDESTMAFYASAASFPGDIFVASMPGGEPRRVTQSLNPEVDPADLVEGTVVRFASYDGLEIPGILYRPHQASAESPVPALVSVHGGPGGQSRIGYSTLTQYLVNHGYAVYAINNRGSSGYGKTFYRMDNRAHGEADLGDVVASKDWLAGMDWVEGGKIGVMGGSYGGYMVLAALTFQPEAFEVGVDIFGVANWLRTLTSIPPWWEAQREALYTELGDPATDEERLRRISPLFYASNIARPLIVLQGANDPRVLQVESDEIVEAVRANGVPVEYIVFPDEGHGFRKKDNQARGYEAVLNFLDQHLRGKAPQAESAGR